MINLTQSLNPKPKIVYEWPKFSELTMEEKFDITEKLIEQLGMRICRKVKVYADGERYNHELDIHEI